MAGGVGSKLTIDADTTRDQLLTFLDQQGAGARILGKKDATTGETKLYVSHSRVGRMLDRVADRAANRRSDARTAVMEVLQRHQEQTSVHALTRDGAGARKALFTGVSDRMHANPKSSLRAGDARQAIRDADAIEQMLPRAAPRAAAAAPTAGPTILDTGLNAQDYHTIAADIAGTQPPSTHGVLSDALQQVADTLGDRIATTFGQANTMVAAREDFAFSDGAALRTQLGKVLGAVLPKDTLDAHTLGAFTHAVFNRAAASVSPEKPVAQPYQQIGGDGPHLPLIHVGGQDYAPHERKGEGGFGVVYEYKSTTSDARIAFKLPTAEAARTAENKAKSVGVFAAEVEAHRQAQGTGHPNVSQLHGAVRLPDGQMGLVLQLANGGDVFGFGKEISQAVTAGTITQAQADALRLTIVKDAAAGLSHMREQGMMHLDFKSVNLIMHNGRTQVMDFGTAQAGTSIRTVDAPKVDSPDYQAPEIIYNKEAMLKTNKTIDDHVNAEVRLIRARIQTALPGATYNQVQNVCRSIVEPQVAATRAAAKTQNDALQFTNAADTYALGLVLGELFLGQIRPGEDTHSDGVEGALAQFSQGDAPFMAPRQADGSLAPGSMAGVTHSPAVTALANRMLNADPGARPDLAKVMSDPLMRAGGAGSDQARALMAALKGGDATAIAQAKTRFEAFVQLRAARTG